MISAVAAAAVAVSTHSRPKAAGLSIVIKISFKGVSTHSRPKAAGSTANHCHRFQTVSTHSRPKAAGTSLMLTFDNDLDVSTHSRPKAAGYPVTPIIYPI